MENQKDEELGTKTRNVLVKGLYKNLSNMKRVTLSGIDVIHYSHYGAIPSLPVPPSVIFLKRVLKGSENHVCRASRGSVQVRGTWLLDYPQTLNAKAESPNPIS